VEELEAVHDCCKSVIEYLEMQREKPEENPQPNEAPKSYSAWNKQKDIPWVPPTKTPEPIVKTPNLGPLARPDGFV
jgi:hypothetical protein